MSVERRTTLAAFASAAMLVLGGGVVSKGAIDFISGNQAPTPLDEDGPPDGGFDITNPRPPLSSLPQAPKTPASELTAKKAVIEANAIKQGNNAFDIAVKEKLLPIIALVEDKTGIDKSLLMAIAWQESSLNPKTNLDNPNQKNALKGSARGIMQIINRTFLEMVQRYIKPYRQEILAYGGDAGKKLIDNEQFLASRDLDQNRQSYLKFLEARINKLAEGLKKKLHNGQKAMATATAEIQKDFEKTLDKHIGVARDNPFISMFFAALDLQHMKLALPPDLSKALNGTEYRLAHMFGPTGCRALLEAYQKFPGATLQAVVGEAAVNQSKLVGNMRVDEYVDQHTWEFSGLRNQIERRYLEQLDIQPAVARKETPSAAKIAPAPQAAEEVAEAPLPIPEKYRGKPDLAPTKPVSPNPIDRRGILGLSARKPA